jgi:hypothetical protein
MVAQRSVDVLLSLMPLPLEAVQLRAVLRKEMRCCFAAVGVKK